LSVPIGAAGPPSGRSYTRPQSDVPDRRGPKALGVTVRTIVKGKNAEIPDRVREYAERKLKRIERLTDDRTDATVELWSEHRRSVADSHFAEVALSINGHLLRSRATGSSYQEALDDVVDKIERQAVGYKEKPRLRSRPDEEKEILRRLADGSEGPPRERQIVKVKRFAIEPMFEEDAVARMEELGHTFFVFVSAETERVAILYQRDDGDLGMIEPVVGGDYTKGRHPSTAPAKAGSGRA
jgi:putative sigma-54 modulation protein